MKSTLTVLSSLLLSSLHAQVWLDASFGDGGVVGTSLNAAYDGAFVVERQLDGKLVVGGAAGTGANFDLLIVRYNTDGSLDTDFGTDGVFTLDLSTNDRCYALAIRSDGVIIAGGVTGTSNLDMLVAQLTPSGELDTFFDTDGILTIDDHASADAVNAIAIQEDNKILVAGRGFTTNKQAFYLTRLLSNGTTDPDFGSAGVVEHLIGTENCEISAMELMSDGRIICAGSTYVDASIKYDLVATRYTSEGQLDASFSGDGKAVVHSSTNDDRAYALALTADGGVLLGGVEGEATSSSKILLARLNSAGTLDDNFGTDGLARLFTGVLPSRCEELAELADGKILACGTSAFDNSGRKGYLSRLNADGTFDTSFGTEGVLEFGEVGQYRETPSMVVASNGDVVVAGITGTAPNVNVLLIRYLNEPTTSVEENTTPSARLLSATAQELHVELGALGSSVRLCDASGRVLHEGRVNPGTQQLVIRLRRALAPGTYLLKAGSNTLRFAISE